MVSEIKTVAIYAPSDEPLWRALKVFISGMQRQGLLNIILWDLRELSPGTDKEKALFQWVNEAHLVLLLLSSNLFATGEYWSIEPLLLQRHKLGSTRILPILLSPMNWKETPWGKLTALPDNDKPVTSWRDRDAAYLNIAEGIRRVERELQSRSLSTVPEDRQRPQEAQQRSSALGYTLLDTLTVHLGPVACVVFSPDGTLLASDSWDGTIILWEVSARRELWRMRSHTSGVYSLAFSPDGRFLASGGADNRVQLWELKTGRCRSILHGHTKAVSSVSFSPDSKSLISGSDDHTIVVWDVHTGNLLSRIKNSHAVLSVVYTTDGRHIISGGMDYLIKQWNVSSTELVMELKGHRGSIHAIALSPDGNFIASGSADHTVYIWHLSRLAKSRPGENIGHSPHLIHQDIVSSVAFRSDGAVLASGSHDKTIKLWDVANGKEHETLIGHTEAVLSVAFHPNLPLLASGSFDKTVKLWGRFEEPTQIPIT